MHLSTIRFAYHRNGVAGEGFYVALFRWRDTESHRTRNMMATLFDAPGQCAVFDVEELAAGNIAFAHGNSWRGDHFEDTLRDALAAQQHGHVRHEYEDADAPLPQEIC